VNYSDWNPGSGCSPFRISKYICYPELKTQGEANRNYLEMAAMGFFWGFQVKMGFCSSQGWAEFSIAIEINNGAMGYL
jgi:hypothetical protein